MSRIVPLVYSSTQALAPQSKILAAKMPWGGVNVAQATQGHRGGQCQVSRAQQSVPGQHTTAVSARSAKHSSQVSTALQVNTQPCKPLLLNPLPCIPGYAAALPEHVATPNSLQRERVKAGSQIATTGSPHQQHNSPGLTPVSWCTPMP